jgi:hypothetical protein
VRAPTGRTPVIFSSVSAARCIRSLLGLVGQHGVELVDPAVDADLVAFGDHLALLVRMEQGGDRRHVERAGTSYFFSS